MMLIASPSPPMPPVTTATALPSNRPHKYQRRARLEQQLPVTKIGIALKMPDPYPK